jgi:hypothetical protein
MCWIYLVSYLTNVDFICFANLYNHLMNLVIEDFDLFIPFGNWDNEFLFFPMCLLFLHKIALLLLRLTMILLYY